MKHNFIDLRQLNCNHRFDQKRKDQTVPGNRKIKRKLLKFLEIIFGSNQIKVFAKTL